MKLERLAITYNDYTFSNDDVAAKSFGGKVVFKDSNGNMTQVILSAATVDKIMQVAAQEVADNARKMLADMTLESIRDSARPLAITSNTISDNQVDIEDGEIVETPEVPF